MKIFYIRYKGIIISSIDIGKQGKFGNSTDKWILIKHLDDTMYVYTSYNNYISTLFWVDCNQFKMNI